MEPIGSGHRAMLNQGAEEMGVLLSDEQMRLLVAYAEMVRVWNDRVRLVADAGPETLVRRHLLDSLSCAQAGCVGAASTVVDVGSGAGFPGVPLAIALGCDVTLLEPSEKKSRFLEEVKAALGLRALHVVRARAETVGRGKLRESFDCAVARAVAALPVVLEHCMPLVRVGGCVVAQKGAPDEAELAAGRFAAAQLGGAKIEEIRLELQETLGGRRTLVVCRKTGQTPERYPRKPGIAEKRPLRP